MISIKENSYLLDAILEDIIYDEFGGITEIILRKKNGTKVSIDAVDEDGTPRGMHIRERK